MWKELISGAEAVIFDLDGTLVDSMWIWKQIDIDYFARYEMTFPDDYQDNIEGMSVYETAVYTKETFGLLDSVDKIMSDWNDMARDKYRNVVKAKSGAIEFIKYLYDNGVKLGIATSNSEDLCMEVLSAKGISDYFSAIITGDDKLKGKPSPDMYEEVAIRLGVSCNRCLVFEDLCNGIMAGKNAGMTTIAVWDDYSSDKWDDKLDLADYHIKSYLEIVDEIFK